MKIRRTEFGNQQPTAPEELSDSVKEARFAEALSQLEAQAPQPQSASNPLQMLRAELAGIAAAADLADPQHSASALRDAARCLVRSRLSHKFQRSDAAAKMIEELSAFVTADPTLKTKLLNLLTRLTGEAELTG